AAAQHGRFHPPAEALYLPPPEARAALAARPRIEVEGLENLVDGGLQATSYSTAGVGTRTTALAEGPLAAAVTRLREWESAAARLVFVAAPDRQPDPPRRPLTYHLLLA